MPPVYVGHVLVKKGKRGKRWIKVIGEKLFLRSAMHRRLTRYMKPFRKSAFIVGHDS